MFKKKKKKRNKDDLIYQSVGQPLEKTGNKLLGSWQIISITLLVLATVGSLIASTRLMVYADIGIVITGTLIIVGFVIYKRHSKNKVGRNYR